MLKRMNENKFIQFLIATGVVQFGDFTLKNGTKSNHFFNFGAIRDGRSLYSLGVYFADCIIHRGLRKEIGAEVLYGPAYKGINLALATSIGLYTKYNVNFPFFYDRKEKKVHGEKGGFVGYRAKPEEGILIVDDVITDCGTKYQQIEKLKDVGKVTGVLVGVDREEVNEDGVRYKDIFESETGLSIYSLTTKSEILKYKEQIKDAKYK
jgi:orotate phosphoribosyltransferase